MHHLASPYSAQPPQGPMLYYMWAFTLLFPWSFRDLSPSTRMVLRRPVPPPLHLLMGQGRWWVFRVRLIALFDPLLMVGSRCGHFAWWRLDYVLMFSGKTVTYPRATTCLRPCLPTVVPLVFLVELLLYVTATESRVAVSQPFSGLPQVVGPSAPLVTQVLVLPVFPLLNERWTVRLQSVPVVLPAF